MSEIELILFLEWLDYTGEVREWAPASDTHEDIARRYLQHADRKVHPTVVEWLREQRGGNA